MSESSEKDFKNQVIERIIFFLVPVVLLIIWQILGNAGIINATIMPTPSSIFKTFLDLLKSGDLAEDLGASMGRVLIGFFFGTLAGLLFGIVTGLYPKIFFSATLAATIKENATRIPKISNARMVLFFINIFLPLTQSFLLLSDYRNSGRKAMLF